MTLDEFIKNRRKLLDAFEIEWREQHEKQPREYPLSVGNLGDWCEQLQAFDETTGAL